MEDSDIALAEDLATLMGGDDEGDDNYVSEAPAVDSELEAMKAKIKEMESKVKLYESQLATRDPKTIKHASEVDPPKATEKMVSAAQPKLKGKHSNDRLAVLNSRSARKEQNGSGSFILGSQNSGNTKNLLEDEGNIRSSTKRKSSADIEEIPSKRGAYDEKLFKEKYTGLRIVNPVVSSILMDQRMEGRKFISLHQIATNMVNNDISGDWVTGGVIVQKMPPKTSTNGKIYSIWRLSSLSPGKENNLVSLFLFGQCHKDLWKTQETSCIALLNPSILPPKEDRSNAGTAISIDNSQRMMLLGTSKDFGVCKGMKRKSGDKCRNFVNRSYGDFCEYHIQSEYKKSRSSRMEFQFGYGAPQHNKNKGKMMKQLRKNIDDGQFFYGGEVVTLGGPKDKKNVTLKSVMSYSVQAEAKKQLKQSTALNAEKKRTKEETEDSEDFKQLLQLPTVGSRNLMKHLKKDEEQEELKDKKAPSFVSITPSELLKQEKASFQKLKNMKKLQTKGNAQLPSRPLLARGCAPDEDIEFADFGDVVSDNLGKQSDPCTFYKKQIEKEHLNKKRMEPGYNKEVAKKRAVALWKERNIDEENNSGGHKKKSPEQRKEILARVAKNETASQGKDENTKKAKGLLSKVFGSIDLNSEEGRKVLDAKSTHSDLVKEDEIKKSGLYFKALEKKEMYEEKLQNITELKVTAYCCKQCKYVAESASKLCQDEKHFLIKVEAKKRFFACKKCKQRTYALNDKIPNHPCRNCGEMNYERVSMYKEKQGPKQERETLLLRGEERKFLNALK